MNSLPNTYSSLMRELSDLNIGEGDGLFIHGSMGKIGATIGGARSVIEALFSSVGETGLIGMPGFSTDAYFPSDIDAQSLTNEERLRIEDAVLGFDLLKSPTAGMGVIAETFRTWPGTLRSEHPTTSICLNGLDANKFIAKHSMAWAMGSETPLGAMRYRPQMKIVLIGVGWNRCTALHTAEFFAQTRRTKTRRFKRGGASGEWVEFPDVADDLNRLFPPVGAAFEQTGAVIVGTLGSAKCLVCDFSELIDFASYWINDANKDSGDRY